MSPTKADEKEIKTIEDMVSVIEGKKPGQTLKLDIMTKGKRKKIELNLGAK